MPNSDELLTIMKKQSEMIAALQHDTQKMKRRLFFMALGSYLRLLIILVPLIIALVYVVPFVKENWKNVEPLLRMANPVNMGNPTKPTAPSSLPALLNQLNAQGIDVGQILKQLQ